MTPFVLLLALAAQATAQPGWRPIGVSGNGRQTSYDPASVVRAGPVTRVSLRFTEQTSYALSTVELRCAAYEARVVGVVTHAQDGTVVNRNEMATPFRAIIIGSFLDTLARAVCGAATGPAEPQ
jgi:hypothetical protein